MDEALLSCLKEHDTSCLDGTTFSCLDEDFDDEDVEADDALARTLWTLFGALPVVGDLKYKCTYIYSKHVIKTKLFLSSLGKVLRKSNRVKFISK